MSAVRYDRPAWTAGSRTYGRRQCILTWSHVGPDGLVLFLVRMETLRWLVAGMSGVGVVVRLTGAGAGSILRGA